MGSWKAQVSGFIWYDTPPKFNIDPGKMVVGRPLSYWEGNFSVAMLNFWGVLVHVFVQHIQDTLRVFVHGSFTSMLLAWPSTFVIESPSWIWWLIPFCRGQNKKQAVTALQYTSCNSHRIHSTAGQWPSQRRHWLGLYYKTPTNRFLITPTTKNLQQSVIPPTKTWKQIQHLTPDFHPFLGLSPIPISLSVQWHSGCWQVRGCQENAFTRATLRGWQLHVRAALKTFGSSTEVPEITAKLSEANFCWLKWSKWPAIEGNPPEFFRSWSRHTKSPCSCCHHAPEASHDGGLDRPLHGCEVEECSGQSGKCQVDISKAATLLRWEGLCFFPCSCWSDTIIKKTSGSISLEGAFICWRRILECIALIEKHWKHFQLTPRLNQMTIQTPSKRLIQWV